MSVDSAHSDRTGAQRSRLGELLGLVAVEGWETDAGRQAVGIMQADCRREAAEWTRNAGWLTDEGLSVVWEQMDRLVRAGRYADAPGLLRIAARRALRGGGGGRADRRGLGVESRADRRGPSGGPAR